MDVRVESVEVDAGGIRNLFRSTEVEEKLLEVCNKRMAEMEADARALSRSPHGPLFVAKVNRLDHCSSGIVVSKGGTGQKGRAENAEKHDLAQTINAKHNFIHW